MLFPVAPGLFLIIKGIIESNKKRRIKIQYGGGSVGSFPKLLTIWLVITNHIAKKQRFEKCSEALYGKGFPAFLRMAQLTSGGVERYNILCICMDKTRSVLTIQDPLSVACRCRMEEPETKR